MTATMSQADQLRAAIGADVNARMTPDYHTRRLNIAEAAGPMVVTGIHLTIGGLLTWGAIACLTVGTPGFVVLGALLVGGATYEILNGLIALVGAIGVLFG